MRIFTNPRELFEETVRDLKEMGHESHCRSVQDKTRHLCSRELLNHVVSLAAPDTSSDPMATHITEELLALMEENGIHMGWARQEASDRIDLGLSPKNPGKAWELNKPFWEQFLHDGRFAYTYAERLHKQIPGVHKNLLSLGSRQAVMTMYDWDQDGQHSGGKARIPCTMSYQFICRRGRIHMNTVMRSCDLYKFFLADLFHSLVLLNYFAHKRKVKEGSFTMFIGSLHAFSEDWDIVF